MIKAVIFDLDGLLIDSEIISYKLYQELLKPYGYEFSINDYAENYSGKPAVVNMNAIIKRFNLSLNIETGLNKVELMEKEFLADGVNLKAGAKELLEYLKTNQYKIAMASSSLKERALDILDKHHIQDYFDMFVFGYEVEKGKPNPDIFLKACEKLGESPEDCLVLEDSEAGIQAAYSANVPVICIPDMKKPNQTYEEMLVLSLDSLYDVISYLEKK